MQRSYYIASMETSTTNDESLIKEQHLLTLQYLENLSEAPAPLNLHEQQALNRFSNTNHPLASQWPLPRVLTWLSSNGYSQAWQATFKTLLISGSTFLDLGSGNSGRGNFSFMLQYAYPMLERQCVESEIDWDQRREREEGKRLRRAIRQIAKGSPPDFPLGEVDVESGEEVGAVKKGPFVARIESVGERRESRGAMPVCAHNEICKLFFENGVPYYCCPRPDEGRCETVVLHSDWKGDEILDQGDEIPVGPTEAFVRISQGATITRSLMLEAMDELADIDTAEIVDAEEGMPHLENNVGHLGVEAEREKARGSMSSWVLPDVPEEEEYDIVHQERENRTSNMEAKKIEESKQSGST
jgi:hypothetical protein